VVDILRLVELLFLVEELLLSLPHLFSCKAREFGSILFLSAFSI
jgi:hypothetical protein